MKYELAFLVMSGYVHSTNLFNNINILYESSPWRNKLVSFNNKITNTHKILCLSSPIILPKAQMPVTTRSFILWLKNFSLDHFLYCWHGSVRSWTILGSVQHCLTTAKTQVCYQCYAHPLHSTIAATGKKTNSIQLKPGQQWLMLALWKSAFIIKHYFC